MLLMRIGLLLHNVCAFSVEWRETRDRVILDIKVQGTSKSNPQLAVPLGESSMGGRNVHGRQEL